MDKFLESDLYNPICEYLLQNGYSVQGEVKDCDITAIKDNELIIIELKKGFTIDLIFQAIKRQKSADGVYVAIPRPKNGYKSRRWKETVGLVRRLDLGLIVVAFTKAKPIVEVAVHPSEFVPQKSKSNKRIAIIKEHNARTGNHNKGGVTRTKLMSAYREMAIHIAVIIDAKGELTPKALKELGASEKAGSILSKNYYKWFEKTESKCYRLSETGLIALAEYTELVEYYRNLF